MADIFISYSREDRERCLSIRKALEALKVTVWSDSGIQAGSSFDREIEREIEAAKALLVLWSSRSVESDWVRNEARTGKERDGLVAVQLDPCQLPLEFRSVQAELLPDGGEGTNNATWLGILSRIGELTNRPGLAEYERLKSSGTLDDWKRWLARYPSDPLTGDVIENIVEMALPDMRQQLAGEQTKRAALEAQLAEYTDASKASSTELATNARELARLNRELDEARAGQRHAEDELARFREATGEKRDAAESLLGGLGIVLEHRLALYIGGLLWFVAIYVIWEPLSNLMNGRGSLGSVFMIAFAVIALFVPAVLVSGKLVRKKRSMLQAEEAGPIEE